MKKLIKLTLLIIVLSWIGKSFYSYIHDNLKYEFKDLGSKLILNSERSGNVDNPNNKLVLVNKTFYLSEDYVPDDLIKVPGVDFKPGITKDEQRLRRDAANHLEAMFKEAENHGLRFFCVSGYRSYEDQNELYNEKLKTSGSDIAKRYVAEPGHSEHQTGLAMDLTNNDGARGIHIPDFGQTEEGRWLRRNAYKFGFILRYPYGKESITGYNYEPWHVRYVGKKAAEKIKNNEETFEEYIESQAASAKTYNQG